MDDFISKLDENIEQLKGMELKSKLDKDIYVIANDIFSKYMIYDNWTPDFTTDLLDGERFDTIEEAVERKNRVQKYYKTQLFVYKVRFDIDVEKI